MNATQELSDLLLVEPLSDENLQLRVKLHLAARHPELSVVSASAEDGAITLEGVLPTYYLRQLSVESARRVAGVRRVIDLIEVVPLPRRVRPVNADLFNS